MKLFGQKHLYFNEEPGDDGAGDGSTAVAPPPPPPTKTFSEDEVNSREARQRRSHDRAIRELQATHTKEIEGLKQQLQEIQQGGDNNTQEGEVELLKRRHAREVEALQEENASLKEQLKHAETKSKQYRRDQLLKAALQDAGVAPKNMKVAERYFKPDIEFDDLDQEWMYKTEKGHLISISDAVSEFLPDNLKPPKIARGGAGTQGGGVRAQRAMQKIESLKQEVADLKAQVAKTPHSNGLVAAWRSKKQQLAQLERELSSAKK